MLVSRGAVDVRRILGYDARASLAIARRNYRILLAWSHTLLFGPSGFFLIFSATFHLSRREPVGRTALQISPQQFTEMISKNGAGHRFAE
jgi:hypothetical protein